MKPILFKTEMVKAILSGQKTVTRRVIKGANPAWSFMDLDDDMSITAIDRYGEEYPKDVPGLWATFESDGYPDFPAFKSPYQIGDILYVREAYAAWNRTEGIMPKLHYKADEENLPGVKWKPSIHMPKEAARLFLKVIDIRIERLQDMTIDDVHHEGVSIQEGFKDFIALWDMTVKKPDKSKCGWEANPWVWCIEFKRCEKSQESEE